MTPNLQPRLFCRGLKSVSFHKKPENCLPTLSRRLILKCLGEKCCRANASPTPSPCAQGTWQRRKPALGITQLHAAPFPPRQPFLCSKARRKIRAGLKHLTPHLCVLSCCPKRAQTAFKTPTPCPLHFRSGRSTLCFRSGALGSAAISGNWA